MQFRFTVEAIDYLDQLKKTFGYEGTIGVVIAPTSCTSCASNGFMVFEIGVWPLSDCKNDKQLIFQNADLPDHMNLFVDKEFYHETADVVIVDYVKMGEMDLLYIPPIPRALNTYNFYKS